MAEVGDEQDEQDRPPHAQVARGPEDEGLIEGEEQVQVGQLGQDDGRAGRHRRARARGRGGVRQRQVLGLPEVCEEGAHERRDGLDD